jgi:PKD domain
MRRYLLMALPFVVSLAAATGARAVVVNVNSNDYGVALVPTAREGTSTTANYLANAGVSIVTSTGPCADPAAGTEPDILSAGSWPLNAPAQPICWHGGGVMHANETFTLQWEGQAPNTYWSTTKNDVQTFLSDVASAKGALDNPYADTAQYWDGTSASDRAANKSVFGGGCDDNGTAKCKFGSITGSGPGNPLPSANSCPVGGDSIYGGSSGGTNVTIPNNLCLTDSDIQHEVTSLVANDGLISHTQPGYTPLVVVMTPPGVEVCLDSAGVLCSVNGRLAPPPPTLTLSSGGAVPAGTYQVMLTYVTASGETITGAPQSVTTTSADGTFTISSPPPHGGVTGWYAYVTQKGGTTFTRQQAAGSPSQIGQDLTLASSPTSTGAAPPAGAASFCSYHGQVAAGGKTVSYVVQPFTAFTACDEPDLATLTLPFTPLQVENNAAARLVSPLSQAEMAAIVNPTFSGWFGLDGLEINDQNSCRPLGQGLDAFTIGTSGQSSYYLQRESNNTSVVDSDPYTYGGCLPGDVLTPAFVSPSAINLGDTIDLDGSNTATSLGIPNANYSWDFGDGSTGNGPSVAHTYGQAGTYAVKLTVTDRGGYTATLSQPVQVLTDSGLPVPPPSPVPTSRGGGGGGSSRSGGLNIKLQLLPQALRGLLARGVAVRVTSSEPADGFATISISRKAAQRAHIKARHAVVVVGTGTVAGLKDGTITLHLRMSRAMARKLAHLKHVTLSVRLALVDKAGNRAAVNVAGNY